MKNKTFSLLSLSILAVVVLASFASAAITLGSAPVLSQTGSSFTIQVTSDTTESITFTAPSITSNSKEITFTSKTVSFVADVAQSITINYTIPSDFEFKFGKTYSTTLTADGTVSDNKAVALSFKETPYYNGDNNGDLNIADLDLDNVEGFGDEDDNILYPFDEATITFYVENNGDSKVKDISIEVCVWDVSAEKCVFDEDDMEVSNNDFDLKSGKDQKITLTFVPEADKLKTGNTQYILYVRAIGEIDDSDSDYDGDDTGASDSYDFEITTDDTFVIINNIQANTNSASCGDLVEITADVWNVGDSELEDDEVFVWIYNKELGINQKIEFEDGIDALESEKITFSFTVPENAAEKVYPIRLGAYDDDSFGDDDLFMADDDDDKEAVFYASFTIQGACSTSPKAMVTPTLQSDAIAGSEFTVKVAVTNTGSSSATFNLALTGYDSWASLVSMDKNSVTLNAGASQDVLIILKANADVSGTQIFTISLTEGAKSLSQPVSVTVAEKSGISFPNLSKLFGNSTWIWVIGALNVLLVLVIVVVAVKVSKKK